MASWGIERMLEQPQQRRRHTQQDVAPAGEHERRQLPSLHKRREDKRQQELHKLTVQRLLEDSVNEVSEEHIN